MGILATLLSLLFLLPLTAAADSGVEVETNADSFLARMNDEMRLYRHLGAKIAWNMSIDMNQEILDKNEEFTIRRNIWTNEWCSKLTQLYTRNQGNPFTAPWTFDQLRQLYLICRGPKFTSYQLSQVLSILSTMQQLYNEELCVDGKCQRMEPDLNRIMESSKDPKELWKIWTLWHKQIGVQVKPLYVSLIHLLNKGARQAGHHDMGECWREETEVPNLKNLALNLYHEVKHLYKLLHTFVRYKLEKFYKINLQGGPIPSHLLGNMYAQNWQGLIDIVWESDFKEGKVETEEQNNFLVKSMLPQNATVLDMVKAAEAFFVSMGLPKLPESFWKNSYFEDQKGESNNARNCHGSAANMFGLHGPDYRLMMCAVVRDEDLVVFQHEIGHVLYFMAYSNLPTIFQDGANSAFHESVGDSVTYDLKLQPSHSTAYMRSLLRTGLAKIPQVGFGLVMDMWRWNVFENQDNVELWNKNWWDLHHTFLGVKRPDGYPGGSENEEGLLDAAGKFHIIDNIPYIRYFLASFLQVQFYDAMCKAAGWEDMHKCQVRGSKEAGNLLWNMMSKGSSKHWSETLEEMTGVGDVQAASFLNYFRPLEKWLEDRVRRYNLTIGWQF